MTLPPPYTAGCWWKASFQPPARARDLLAQAKLLYDLAEGVDEDYLERRIRTESMGDYGAEDVED